MILAVMGIIIYEVVSRRVFHSPHIWTYEIITFFYAVHFMILAAYTLVRRAHVSIDIFYLRMSPKGQAIIDVVTYLVFFFPFLILFFKAGMESSAASWATAERTITARLPIVMPAMKTITPVACVLLLLQGLANFLRSLLFLVTKEKL